MRYIKQVILENFQSHKYSVIDLSSQLNVIVGPSDSGKSAIIRGIKWVLYNEPSGDYFIKEGETYSAVTLIFGDNVKVKRYRSKTKNAYYLYNQDGDELKFEGFGTRVPEEIINMIGIEKIFLDGDQTNAINLGEQLEGSFLISERGATRASAIGRLVGVNVIDDALKETLRDSRNTSITMRHLEDSIIKLETELKEYNYLDDLNSRINKLENFQKIIHHKEEKLDKLKELNNSLIDTNNNLIKVRSYLDRLNKIDKLEEIVKKINDVNFTYNIFRNKQNVLRNVKENIRENTHHINKFKELDKVIGQYNRLSNLCRHKNNLINLNNKYTNSKSDIKTMTTISNSLTELDKIEYNISQLSDKMYNLLELNNIESKLVKTRKNINIGIEYISKLQNINRIDSLYSDLKKKEIYLNKLILLKSKYKDINNGLKKDQLLLQNSKNEMDNLLVKYKEILEQQEICPFCLSNINEDKIEHIINHYN